MNRGIKLQLFGTLRSLKGDYDTNDDLVSWGEVIPLLSLQLSDLALPYFFGLFDLDADRSSEVFHQHFSLLHLWRKDLRRNHWAEGNLGAEFLRNSEGDCGLACAGRASEQQGSSGHFFRLDEVYNNSCGFSSHDLSNHTLRYLIGEPVFPQS